MKKYSDSYERDWKFYRTNKDKFNFFGAHPPVFEYHADGVSAKRAFLILDSTGKAPKTRENNLLSKVIACKKSVNWHIKQWSDGYVDFCEPVEYYMNSMNNTPEWVYHSIKGQVFKRFGYVPSYSQEGWK